MGDGRGYHVSREWFGPFLVAVIIHHPEIWKQLVKRPKFLETYEMFDPWLSQGLLLASGKRWARNRRLLTGAFHFDILKPYIQVYNECTDILINKWMGHVTSGEPVLVYKTVSQLTLLRCSLSYNSHCQEQQKASPHITAVKCHGLSWTLYFLAKYPEHQEKHREEINEVLGNRKTWKMKIC